MHYLLALAEQLGLTVIERPGVHAGGYRSGDNLIRLEPGLSRRAARSVLAHEIGHHVLGHQPTHFGPLRARQERAANEWAALQLIDNDAYVEAERLRDGHVRTMAHDLDVVHELVTAYRGMLTRIGDVTYLRSRMGAGQWERRAS